MSLTLFGGKQPNFNKFADTQTISGMTTNTRRLKLFMRKHEGPTASWRSPESFLEIARYSREEAKTKTGDDYYRLHTNSLEYSMEAMTALISKKRFLEAQSVANEFGLTKWLEPVSKTLKGIKKIKLADNATLLLCGALITISLIPAAIMAIPFITGVYIAAGITALTLTSAVFSGILARNLKKNHPDESRHLGLDFSPIFNCIIGGLASFYVGTYFFLSARFPITDVIKTFSDTKESVVVGCIAGLVGIMRRLSTSTINDLSSAPTYEYLEKESEKTEAGKKPN